MFFTCWRKHEFYPSWIDKVFNLSGKFVNKRKFDWSEFFRLLFNKVLWWHQNKDFCSKEVLVNSNSLFRSYTPLSFWSSLGLGRSRLWTKVTFVAEISFVNKVVHKRYFVHKRYHIFVHKWFFVHKRYCWDFLIINQSKISRSVLFSTVEPNDD